MVSIFEIKPMIRMIKTLDLHHHLFLNTQFPKPPDKLVVEETVMPFDELFTTVLLCLDHDSLLVMWAPRNYILSTRSITAPSM